ncbi:hypothetical protein L1049_004028 [Liquidambar formosana]|uniref:Transcriptional adapter 1 n=1 Tax=Liquidambar formosana TaxID=63359 RepID=A0AAP0RSI8_LIQFO
MQPRYQHPRINLVDLKAQFVKKLGLEKSKQYFYLLNKLLSLKLSKVEFNKLCFRIIGRENVPLHNQLIRSILKNACCAKVPPPTHGKEALESTILNGDIFQFSSQKIRLENRDRKKGDCPGPFAPNGKADFYSHSLTVTGDGGFDGILENGDLTPYDTWKPVQHHQGLMRDLENEGEFSPHKLANLPPIKRSSPDGPFSVHSNNRIEVEAVEDGKKVSDRSTLSAPLGIPLCSLSVGGARRAFPLENSCKNVSSFDSGGLIDTEALKEHMELIAASQGLEGVSMDCANLLNNGLDAYLKGLIRSCIELVGARSGHEPLKNIIQKNKSRGKLVNGVLPGHHYQMQGSRRPSEAMQEQRSHCPISLLDFKVAMELNPRQLGEDWPLLLEKICMHAFEK